jgi:hypothetical protein
VRPAWLAMMMLGGVTDQGGRAADVGGQGQGDQERRGGQVQALADQDGDRGDQQHGGDVVEQGRGDRGQHDQGGQDPVGAALGFLGRPDGQVFEQAGLFHDPDDDHHAQQQEDDLPVDAEVGGVEGVLGRDQPQGQHEAGPSEGDHDPVDLLGGDQDIGHREHGDARAVLMPGAGG